MSRIVCGVAGGIAAYKACEVLRRFRDAGHDVTVVPTANALEFVGAATWAALSGRPVQADVFNDAQDVPHVRLGQQAELVVVAPATADLLARAASGRADDLLTTVLLTARCPVLFVPAMHTEMWQHPATQDNVETLRSRGALVMDPAVGRLTGADSGQGRLPEPHDIVAVATSLLEGAETVAAVRSRDLAGKHVVISAGGTREPLDPVRFLGNASSGRQGIALARAATLRGARVTLVVGNVSEPLPSGAEVVRVGSTAELGQAMMLLQQEADAIVMAVAAADFTPADVALDKIKKDGSGELTLHLTQTVDVLALLSRRTSGPADQVIVGFAAETASDEEHLLTLGQAKLARKGCDLLVLNNVSGGAVFGKSDNAVTIIAPDRVVLAASGTKATVAHRIWDAIVSTHL